MTTTSEQRAQDPAALRAAMVSELRGDNIASEPVAAAFSVEPRHLFAPGEPLEAVYDSNTPLVTKTGPDGTALSSVSAAHTSALRCAATCTRHPVTTRWHDNPEIGAPRDAHG